HHAKILRLREKERSRGSGGKRSSFYCKSTTRQEQRGAIHKNFVELTGLGGVTSPDVFGRSSTKGGRKPHETGPPHGEMGIGSRRRFVGFENDRVAPRPAWVTARRRGEIALRQKENFIPHPLKQ
ncbi:hypothetical protein DQ04_12861020, partial [Trypanosoma grayi]|uniref:hypothetical protein n=1 Tax=Trypanosoma grayi TaxID=71804 RepID=UPI0004F4A465